MAKRACPMCGESIPVDASKCPYCAEDFNRKEKSEGDTTGGVIPYKNMPALIGYYCAVFSLIPCLGAVLGLVALVLGIMGLRAASQNPAIKGQVHAWVAIVLGGLCAFGNIAVVAIGIIAAAAN